ncbi:MAG: DUF4846 domain-containing protein, partial [Myxococcota bacterium]
MFAFVISAALATGAADSDATPTDEFPWTVSSDSMSLRERVPTEEGHRRGPETARARFFRSLPVKAGRPEVRLFDGRRKSNQLAHHLVFDIDVGRRDLQQCADAAMRLWAEMLWARGESEAVCFRFTSGDRARWSAYAAG